MLWWRQHKLRTRRAPVTHTVHGVLCDVKRATGWGLLLDGLFWKCDPTWGSYFLVKSLESIKNSLSNAILFWELFRDWFWVGL